jgi:branched-chain amino acid transport system permease protein
MANQMVTIVIDYILNGIVIGSGYALIAIGLTMIFGLMEIVNFAHGEFYMIGGFIAFYLVQLFGLNFFASLLVSIATVMVLGLLFDRVIFAPLRGKPIITTALVTIGLSIFMQNFTLYLWGATPKTIPSPFSRIPMKIGPIFITQERVFATLLTFAIIIGMHLFLKKTKAGKALRATFQGKEAAALVGINIDRVYAITFAVGVGLSATAGSLLGSIFYITPTVGGMATLKAFIIVILGGMGSFPGAIVGGLTLGVAESLGAGFISSAYKDAIGFIIVIILLLFRPQGLFGTLIGK